LHILLINDYSHFGGAEVVFNSLNKWLTDHGYKTSKITADNILHKHFYLTSNIMTTLLTFNPFLNNKLFMEMEKIKTDLIHCHNISLFGISPIKYAIKKKLPCIITLHDYWFVSPQRNLFDRSGNPCHLIRCPRCSYKCVDVLPRVRYLNAFLSPIVNINIKLRRIFLKKVNIVAVSNFMKNLLSNFLPEDKITVIHNGIDIARFTHVKSRFDFDNGIKILYLGGQSEAKGFSDVIKIGKLLKDAKKDFEIIVCGKGFNRKYETPAHFNVKGFIPRKHVFELLSLSHCLIFPSRTPEPFSISILEAMAFRRPVIAYNVGGVSDAIIDGYNGFLVRRGDYKSLADKIVYLSEHPQEIKRLGENGFKVVSENYSLQSICQKYETLYQKVLDTS